MSVFRNRILLFAAPMTLLMTAGCVGGNVGSANRSWPKPIVIAETKQFDGVFGNQSLDAKTGKASDKSQQLFDFLTSRSHSHGKRGMEVEMRSSPDGTILHVRLFDQEHLEIDSSDLQRGVDFDLPGGFMSLHGPYSGTHSTTGNIGASITHQRSRLYVTSTGALLGKRSETGAGLLFYVLPMMGTTREWSLWPKLPPKEGAKGSSGSTLYS